MKATIQKQYPQAQHFLAPAKLNLDLRVVGRRDDGYHLLETVFRFIDLYDHVILSPREDGKLVLHTPIKGVPTAQDLSMRAAKLLQEKTQTTKGADIWVEKNIPMGGGLGGGSSDAATVLLGLNHLWQTGFSREQLMKLGLMLGADVPAFVFGENSFATGIGEELTPLSLQDRWYVVLHPNVHIDTGKVFQQKSLTSFSPMSIMRTLETPLRRRNDLQDVVLSGYPQVKAALDLLDIYGYPLMTGSGSCVFLELFSKDEAEKVFQAVSLQVEAYCVAGLANHPLLGL